MTRFCLHQSRRNPQFSRTASVQLLTNGGMTASVPINWQTIIETLVATVGGGGVLLAAVAWLIKTLVSNRLALDTEKFKIEMKASADTQIERVKAFLVRASRVHERQLDILGKLFRDLSDAQSLFQNMTRTGRMAGEITPEEYYPKVMEAMKAAYEEFLNGRLFIPSALVQQCEGFFSAVFEGQQDFSLAHIPQLDPAKRAEFWTSAATVAHQRVPKILAEIEEAARAAIHGEPPD